ncbi:MAG: hypothetical protein EH225_07225 [Calditrichaeota bacterium]|nr:hypothetical protein [Calditrichota bacterium]RQW03376.1 MAG: hypothetical protein EH225_07225 [Calditrichota bacterium]
MVSGLTEIGFPEAWTGLVIAWLNFLTGAIVIARGINKPDKLFYTAFFGGMFVRFAAMFILLLVLFYFGMEQFTLILSLLVAYFSFLALEIWIIHQSSLKRGNSG